MYIISDMCGDFETRIIISVNNEDLYYIELTNYGEDFVGTIYAEFEEYPSRDDVLSAIEDCLDTFSERFMSGTLSDDSCMGMYDIETNDCVSYEELRGVNYSYWYENTIELESYEVEELDA